MQSSVENESNDAVFDFDDQRRSSDDEWQFVSKVEEVESDDDSIEVIERETVAPSSILPSDIDTEIEESDNEENFKYLRKEAEPANDPRNDEVDQVQDVRNDVNLVDIRNEVTPVEPERNEEEPVEILTIEEKPVEIMRKENRSINDVRNGKDSIKVLRNQQDTVSNFVRIKITTTVVPQPCQTCTALSFEEEESRVEDVTNGITWKVLYSFFLGVVASLIFHHYKDCIPEKFSCFRFGSELSIAGIYSFSFPFAQTNPLDEELNSLKLSNVREDTENLLNRLKSSVEKQTIIAEGIFTRQLHLLEHVSQVKSDVYVFNVTKLAQSAKNEENFITKLRSDKAIIACDDNITSENLPIVCEDNRAVLVYVQESRIMSMYDAIQKFSSDTEKRANSFHENLVSSLTESGDSFSDEGTNTFVPDCDEFSKRYKTNAHCVKKTEGCEETKSTFSKHEDELSDKSNVKVGAIENSAVEEEGIESTEGVEDEAKKPVSEPDEWSFDLHKAQEKIRTYYDRVVKGDWILKLGKAREKLRKNENRHRPDSEEDLNTDDIGKKGYHWYKKTSDKFKRKLKTYFAKAQVQLKMTHAAISDKFKDLKSDLKKKLLKWKNTFENL